MRLFPMITYENVYNHTEVYYIKYTNATMIEHYTNLWYELTHMVAH